MRLIDADELNEYIGRESLDTREKIFALVDRMPTLPNPCGKPCAFERPHGEWISRRDKFGIHLYSVCSECNVAHNYTDFPNFCPNCGSDNRPRILDEAFDGAGKYGNVKEAEAKKCPNCGSDLYEHCFMCCYEGEKVIGNE